VAVDQPRAHAGAARVDVDLRRRQIGVLRLADEVDQAVDDDDRVGIEQRPVDVARQQQSDVADRMVRAKSWAMRMMPPRCASFSRSRETPS
jgi:hypothetical protein